MDSFDFLESFLTAEQFVILSSLDLPLLPTQHHSSPPGISFSFPPESTPMLESPPTNRERMQSDGNGYCVVC
ncbi:hypothetical protein BDN72DRAFT_845705 [Pluteus cervinus]|uniref:Uncharacterized protein n=1 Tax=Pluteus cervinus TaxID=181527 RepID=A0ACD3AID0_9AGAR|nr:hypothetical protein BDN72DRAFT_845705 [Pluteus cervinus]